MAQTCTPFVVNLLADLSTVISQCLGCALSAMQKEQAELAHAQRSYDDAEPWHLPIGHRPQDSLDTEGLTMASTDTAIPEDNKGYKMLQKMGWKGTGLGRDENGQQASMHA